MDSLMCSLLAFFVCGCAGGKEDAAPAIPPSTALFLNIKFNVPTFD